jgi:hypothetical protein
VESLKPDLIPDLLPSDPRPVQDEWGIYDPEQAGFEAVLRRLGVDDDHGKKTPQSDSSKR